MSTIRKNLEKIRQAVEEACQRAGRAPSTVRILGASKKQPPQKIREAFEAGLRLIGENYVQEARDKKTSLEDLPLQWHLIGPLQTNKARYAVKLFHCIQTIDRPAIVKELSKRAKGLSTPLEVLIEVNVGGEETKAGVNPEELPSLAEQILETPFLELKGLMTIPPYRENPEEVRPFFALLRGLREDLKRRFPEAPLTELSMGMSHDFKVAIEEGATIVRIGTALFGPRDY